MIVYFTTIYRYAPIPQSGEVVKLDWKTKQVKARVPIYPVDPDVIEDPNPRGGARGGRGVLVNGDMVVAASHHSLHLFDRDLKSRGRISHPLFTNLHELCWDGDAIWVTSTGVDAAIKVNRAGETLDMWFAKEDPYIAKRYGMVADPIDKTADNRLNFMSQMHGYGPNHLHLNAVAVRDGRPVALLHHRGAVVGFRPTELLIEDGLPTGCHNIVVGPDGHMLVNDSKGGRVLVFGPEGRFLRAIDLRALAPVRAILRRYWAARLKYWLRKHGKPRKLWRGIFGQLAEVQPVWVRGLCVTPRNTLLVGISPAGILEVNWTNGELVDWYPYSDSLMACIHGLQCVPA